MTGDKMAEGHWSFGLDRVGSRLKSGIGVPGGKGAKPAGLTGPKEGTWMLSGAMYMSDSTSSFGSSHHLGHRFAALPTSG